MAKKTKKLLRRPQKDRVVAGVCAAFANYLDIDVVLIRLLWVFLLIPGGLPGILPYLLCWVVIPSEKK